ncbi:MAG: amidase domain-containing protein [Chloroflexota bacterium]
MLRKLILVVVLLSMVFVPLLPTGRSLATTQTRQPKPAAAGESAPEIQAAYEAAQRDTLLSEQDRVRSAVDTYFHLKYASMVKGISLDLGIVVDASTERGQLLHDYELGRLQYSLHFWRDHKHVTRAYDYRPIYESFNIVGDTATLRVRPLVEMTLEDGGTPHVEVNYGEPHVLGLSLSTTGWRVIADDYLDEMKSVYPIGTDWASLQATYAERMAAARQQWMELSARHGSRSGARDGGVTPLAAHSYYDGNAAAWYANTYTNDSGDCSTANYNSLFYQYATNYPTCNDCTNFASQAIWYGFGGTNDESNVQSHNWPMIQNIGGATNWYGDYYYTNSTWSALSNLHNLIRDNYYYNQPGPQGYDGGLSELANGDLIIQGADGHAMIVAAIYDWNGDGANQYGEVYFSAHTNNRHIRQLLQYVDPSQAYYVFLIMWRQP